MVQALENSCSQWVRDTSCSVIPADCASICYAFYPLWLTACKHFLYNSFFPYTTSELYALAERQPKHLKGFIVFKLILYQRKQSSWPKQLDIKPFLNSTSIQAYMGECEQKAILIKGQGKVLFLLMLMTLYSSCSGCLKLIYLARGFYYVLIGKRFRKCCWEDPAIIM